MSTPSKSIYSEAVLGFEQAHKELIQASKNAKAILDASMKDIPSVIDRDDKLTSINWDALYEKWGDAYEHLKTVYELIPVSERTGIHAPEAIHAQMLERHGIG